MSRRRRKKTSTREKHREQSSNKSRGLWWKLVLSVIVLLVAGGLFAYNQVITFLHSDDFREDISEQVGAELGSVVTFGDFKWDGLSAKNDSFKSSGDGAIMEVEAKDIALDVKLDYLKRDKFRLENVTVGSLNAELDLREDFLRFELEKKEKGFFESLLPDEVELLDAEISEINAKIHTDSGDYIISGVKMQTLKDDEAYNANISGGIVDLPLSFLKTARLEDGEIKQFDEEIYVKDTKFRIFDSGTITLNGVVDLAPRARYLYDMEGELTGLRCKDVFPDAWHRHLTGEVLGGFKIKPYQGTEPKIEGRLEIKDGTLQALPILNKVSLYLAEPKYRTLEFQKFECDFEKFRDQTHLRNIILTSNQLIQIEGDLKIDGINLDGVFDVGIPERYLSKIPGAKNGVFRPGKDHLLWTRVKIGGDFDDITEDLSDRLILAAAEDMMRRALEMGLNPEAAKQLLKGSNGALENLNDVLKGDKGVIDGGLDTAKGILEGLTGSTIKEDENKDEDDKEKEEEKNKDKEEEGLIPKIPKIPDLEKILPFL